MKDLIVGAPYYSKNDNQYDNGAIYVYIQKSLNVIKIQLVLFYLNKISYFLKNNFKSFETEFLFNYTGKVNSNFGMSLASIGDIDNDGYNGEYKLIFVTLCFFF